MTVGRIAPFTFDRSWDFPVSPSVFWQTVSATDDFPLWWGWLHAFESEGLATGSENRLCGQAHSPTSCTSWC